MSGQRQVPDSRKDTFRQGQNVPGRVKTSRSARCSSSRCLGQAGQIPLSGIWLTIPPSALFLVSVAAKGLRLPVSLLESILMDAYASVASKGLVCTKIVQKAVCFVSVANRGLRLKSRLQKAKTPAGMLAFPGRAQYYPRNTVRWDSLFVNRKLEKSRVRPRGKAKTPALKSRG